MAEADAETFYPYPHVSTTSTWESISPTSSSPEVDMEETQGRILHTVDTWKNPSTSFWDYTEDNVTRDVRGMARMLEDKFRQPLSPGYAVFLYECRIGREHDTIFDPSPNMNRHGTTTTIEETEIRASAIAMLPGATTSTVTESVQWPGGFAASVITSTDRIMGSIVRPLPPAGGHVYVYWDTVMWEYETRTTTAPDYGTLTEEIIWTVVHREVHMTPGYQVAGGLVYRRLHPTATTCWSQTVYSEAGKSYDEEKEAALDRPLDKWLKRKMRRNPQCGKKHKRGRGKVMVKRKRKAAMKITFSVFRAWWNLS
ncbi:hypothetical protein B0T09DRAFT_321452 [Sordaria sp. MPI-SDFR-AT-0083]|nr:hypothetical protein B0T09DRAFT_321452 [Sordaria sp. MPI-SDFR-AT-0083]